MALNLISRYLILTNRGVGPDLLAGQYISTFWNDISLAIEVYEYDDASDTSGTLMTTGPDLGSISRRTGTGDYKIVSEYYGDTTRNEAALYSIYYFCDGTDINKFKIKSTFPYVLQIEEPSNFCVAAVCDLNFSDDYTVTNASDSDTADGSLQVSATSSNGTIKYSLAEDFDYANEGQTTGLFSSLLPGTYIVIAKDSIGCTDRITIQVKVPSFYNVLYRLEYTDANSYRSKVDILQRGYIGDTIEVKAGEEPFILKYRLNGSLDKFDPIVPSFCELSLKSESNFYFRDLFSQDDRKYQIRFYKDFGIIRPASNPFAPYPFSGWANEAGPGPNWTTGSNPSVVTSGSDSDALRSSFSGIETSGNYNFSYNVSSTGNATISIKFYKNGIEISGGSLNAIAVFSGVNTGTFSLALSNIPDEVKVTAKRSGIIGTPTVTLNSFSINIPEISSYQLKWIGFVISDNYSEAYLAPPYEITITATDGLEDLNDVEWRDQFKNKFRDDITPIKSIVECLKHTDLGLNIIEAVNKFEENMDLSISPLLQCKFDPKTFYEDKVSSCFTVIQEILKPFGARLLQVDGKWTVYCIEEMVHTLTHRELSSEGQQLYIGTIAPNKSIKFPTESERAAFRDRRQLLEICPAYGVMFFEYTLLKNPSLVASYSFEPDDIFVNADGIPVFKNWNVNILNAPGANFGIKATKSFEGDFTFYYRPPAKADSLHRYVGEVGYGEISLLSKTFPIEFDETDAFEFRFNYAVILYGIPPQQRGITPQKPGVQPTWVRIKWMLKSGDFYFNQSINDWSDDVAFKYNDIYVSGFNETSEFKIVNLFRLVTALTNENIQIEIILCSQQTVDFDNYTDFKALATTQLPIDYKIKLKTTYGFLPVVPIHYYYTLTDSDDSESSPDRIRPNDFATTTNERVWVLESSVDYGTIEAGEIPVRFDYIDNVVLLHLPKQLEAPANITYEKDNNENIKRDFEGKYLLNDIDIDNINNSERTYKNFFKLLNDDPTQIWSRAYRSGQGKILELFTNDFASQYKRPSNKLGGSFVSDIEIKPYDVLTEVNDEDRKYMFQGYELLDKKSSVNFDILEVKDVVTNDESDDVYAEFNTDFNLDFTS